MNRNLILLASIFLFLFGLRIMHHSILIINDSNSPKKVYMENVSDKVDMVKAKHEMVKKRFIFAEMMADNDESLINAVMKNNPNFWINEIIREGSDSKFDKLIQTIIRTNKLDINYKGSLKLRVEKKDQNIQKQLYQLNFSCEYEDLISFVSALEKNDRIYNIEELRIKNSLQKNISGVYVHMKVNEYNIGGK